MRVKTLPLAVLSVSVALLAATCPAADPAWTEIPPACWKGTVQAEAPALKRSAAAEDDMAEMTPDVDFWSSGQTNCRMHKPTLRRQIRLAHEQGLAVATYGKFVMSGRRRRRLVY
jgi:hypothetical protein